MSILLEKLEKRTKSVGIILEKHNIVTIPPVRVGLMLDVSGSAQGLYTSGVIQETTDRLMAVAMKFDDNGELDMWAFENRATRLETATLADYEGFVKREILDNRNVHKWGGTSYSPVMEDALNFYFPQSLSAGAVVAKATGFLSGLFGKKQAIVESAAPTAKLLPACGILVTDGECDDKEETEQLIVDSQKHQIYWQLVGVGDARHFGFLEHMADKYPNVGYVNLSSLSITDDQLYGELIAEEFCGWIKQL